MDMEIMEISMNRTTPERNADSLVMPLALKCID